MDREQIKKTFYSILNSSGYKPGDIDESFSFNNDLGMDSLEMVELIIEVEKKFNIAVTDEQMENMHHSTVGDAIDIIHGMVE
jgi:acyl carrier protein